MKLPLRVVLPAAVRRYATRRPERPPSKIKDPLLSSNATHHPVAPDLTFIHRPPPTAPSPFSLTTAPSSPLLLPPMPLPSTQSSDASTSTAARLPPLIRKSRKGPETKLTKEQIEEMKQLRATDPLTFTRSKLAKQYGCTTNFIQVVAPLSKTEMRKAVARRDQEHDANRNRWGEKKIMAVAIRKKRRTLW